MICQPPNGCHWAKESPLVMYVHWSRSATHNERWSTNSQDPALRCQCLTWRYTRRPAPRSARRGTTKTKRCACAVRGHANPELSLMSSGVFWHHYSTEVVSQGGHKVAADTAPDGLDGSRGDGGGSRVNTVWPAPAPPLLQMLVTLWQYPAAPWVQQ